MISCYTKQIPSRLNMPCGSCSSVEISVFCNRCCGGFCSACKEKDFLCIGPVTNHVDVSRCIVYLMKEIEFYEDCLKHSKKILSEIEEKHKISTYISTPVVNVWTDEDESESVKIAKEHYNSHLMKFSITPAPYQGMPDYKSLFSQCLQNARRQIQQRKGTETWTKLNAK